MGIVRVERFHDVVGEDLPPTWRARLGLGPADRVNLVIRAVPSEPGSLIADPEAFEAAIDDAHAKVRWNEKTDEEIIGYDEFGLPT